MTEERREKIEALATLSEYNGRIMQNMPIIIKELSGERLEDTDTFLNDILKAINWEIQVVNSTLDVINEGETRLDKEEFNQKIVALNDAVVAKDDGKMAEAFANLMPVLDKLGMAVKVVIE